MSGLSWVGSQEELECGSVVERIALGVREDFGPFINDGGTQ